VRQKLREMNNDLLPNDLNHDEKSLANAESPLCKCNLDYQSHMSIDYDTYGMRNWSCSLPTSLFNWSWDEEKSRKVVSVLTLIVPIPSNVMINYFTCLKGVRVELFPLPPKLLGCDFKQWIDDYMTPRDEENVAWIKKNSAMRKGASSIK
jgi:hypothetical protein